MPKRHDGPHDGTNPYKDPDELSGLCFGCRIKQVEFDPYATPSRVIDRPQPIRPMAENPWANGVAGEHRPGGGFMPYLDGDGKKIGVKQYADNRGQFDQIRKDQIAPSSATLDQRS